MMHAEDEISATGSAAVDRRASLRRFVPLAVIGLIMAFAFVLGWHRHLSVETLVRHRAAIEAFVAAYYPVAIAAFVAVYVVCAALSLPVAACLSIAGGFLFGWLIGGAANIVGATIGATVIFLIVRTACGGAILRRAGPLAAKVAKGFRADAFNYLLFLRLVPAFPFVVVNIAPALVGVRLETFVAATAIGIIPGAFAYALVGAGLDSLIGAQAVAYQRCLAAGGADCRLDFSLPAVVTPQVVAALVALGIVALIPVAVRKWRARTQVQVS
jgi:uncharacterized membrane protein YdjX (TVP38/TMEM64 family)